MGFSKRGGESAHLRHLIFFDVGGQCHSVTFSILVAAQNRSLRGISPG